MVGGRYTNQIRLSNESSAKNPTMIEPCTFKGRKSVSVGSVCVLCVRRALVRVTSQTSAPTATASAALGLDPNR